MHLNQSIAKRLIFISFFNVLFFHGVYWSYVINKGLLYFEWCAKNEKQTHINIVKFQVTL